MNTEKLKTPETLIDENSLKARINEMGRELTEAFKERKLTVISISNGATVFVADLIRQINLPLQLDSITAHSYSGTESSGKVKMLSKLKLDISGRNILIVDDILDTGRTMKDIVKFLKTLNPDSVATCVLLDKPSRRLTPVEADYVGFEVPDVFVVGYGLDYNEYYRNLPFVGRLNPSFEVPEKDGLTQN